MTEMADPGAESGRLGAGVGVGLLAVTLALAVWSVFALELHDVDVGRTWEGLEFLFAASFPPDTSVLAVGLRGLEETLYIAYLGTVVGVALALPVSLLASRTFFPLYVTTPARWLLAGLRVLPSILWAIIFVILVGTGPLAGVLAIGIYTVGFVGKLQYEIFEGLEPGPLQAVGALGATRLQVLRFVTLPQSLNAVLAQAFFMFEYNVRHASAIGIVGAGGIGYYIMGYLEFFAYDRAIVLLGIVFVVVIAIDELSYRLRSLYFGGARASMSA